MAYDLELGAKGAEPHYRYRYMIDVSCGISSAYLVSMMWVSTNHQEQTHRYFQISLYLFAYLVLNIVLGGSMHVTMAILPPPVLGALWNLCREGVRMHADRALHNWG